MKKLLTTPSSLDDEGMAACLSFESEGSTLRESAQTVS